MKGLSSFMLKNGPALTVLSKFSVAVEETAAAAGMNFSGLDSETLVEMTRAVLLTLDRLDADGKAALAAALAAMEGA